jgi:spectinomycin phosphotransferase
VEGRDGYEVELPQQGWTDLGATLRRIHAIELQPSLQGRIPREAFSSHWRDVLRLFMARIAHATYTDSLSASVAAFLRERSDHITHLIERADTLADRLRVQPPEYVLCHYDLHAGNLLIAPDTFYIVDWDNPLLAPKERDLMFIGGGLMGGWHAPPEEEALFYPGYGPTQIHPAAMAYYRYARIVEDIAVECEQIFQVRGSVEDREQEFFYLRSNFVPNGVLDLAYRTDGRAGGA